MEYKGFFIAEKFHATSQNPGQGHSVAEAISKTTDLDNVMSYENEAVVDKISKDLGMSLLEAKIIFSDVKMFLWMSAMAKQNTVPPPLVDEAWYSFILFTKDYAEFCARFFEQFIHHLPHRPRDPIIGPEEIKPTIDLILDCFGKKPSSNWDYVNLN